jgi:hypothetical protein
MKKGWKIFLGHVVGAIGIFVFWIVRMLLSAKNKKDAQLFEKEDVLPKKDKESLLKDMGVVGTTYEERVKEIKKVVEDNTKEEIIYAFKKSFGLSHDSDNDDGNSTPGA